MKLKSLVLVFCMGVACAAAALPELSAGKAKAIELDGVLDEKDWASSEWSRGFTPFTGDGQVQATRVKALCGERGLYLGIDASDSFVKSEKRPENGPVWHDDSIEILLEAEDNLPEDKNTRLIRHFIINPDNSFYAESIHGGVPSTGIRPYFKSAARRTDGGYAIEAFFPWHTFGGTTETAWRMNIIRSDWSKENTMQLSAWAPTRAVNDDEAFGRLRQISCPPNRYGMNVLNLSMKRTNEGHEVLFQLAKENRVIQGDLEATVILAKFQDDGFRAVGRLPKVAFGETDGKAACRIPVTLPSSGDYMVTVILSDNAGTLVRQAAMLHADLAFLVFSVQHPVYRHTLYPSDKERVLSLKLLSALGEKQAGEYTLKVTARHENGTMLRQQQLHPVPQSTDVQWDAAAWPAGTVTFEAYLAAPGKEFRKETSCDVIIAGKPDGNEVRLDDNGSLMLNGQPFFMTGFMGIGDDLEDMAAAGCNTVHSYVLNHRSVEDILKCLDACQAKGLKMIMKPYPNISIGFWGVNIGGKTIPRFTEAQMKQIAVMVNAIKHHPALLGYYTFDEPRGAEWQSEILRCYELLRKLDPFHPVVGCDCSGSGLLDLKRHCDVAVLDLYPAPYANGLPQRPISTIGDAMALCARELGEGKVLIACPQGFDADSFVSGNSPRERRAPTYEENRACVFASLAQGAKGVLIYKIGQRGKRYFERFSNTGIYGSPEMKIGFLEGIVPELVTLQAYFKGTEQPVSDVTRPVKAKVYRRASDGKGLMVIVNPTEKAVTARWRLPEDFARCARELSGIALQDGVEQQEALKPYQVLLIVNDADTKLPARPQDIRSRIDKELEKMER